MSKRLAAMPTTFTPETVIGEGWRCSQALRAFFELEIGPRFHFNQVMRDFIKHGSGKTLADAISAWQADVGDQALDVFTQWVLQQVLGAVEASAAQSD